MDPIVKLVIIAAIIIAIVIVIVKNIKIVPQAHAYVIERLGTYQTTWNTGLHLKVPFVDRIAKKLSLKEQVVDFPPQPVTLLLLTLSYILMVLKDHCQLLKI